MIIRNQEPIGPSGLAQVKARRKAGSKIKFSTIAVYASVFILVVSIISIGYNQPQSASSVANIANTNTDSTIDKPSVDSVVAADVAANVARVTDLPVSDNVSNLAVTIRVKNDVISLDGISTTKPQIIEPIADNRLVTNYVAVAGDTVASLAAKYKISEQTIKWANNLTGNYIPVGSTVKILPIDGVLYSVKDSDTIDTIAAKYKVDKTRLVLYNDLDVSGLKSNTSIILPSGDLPEEERPGYVAPIVYTQIAYGYSGGDMVIISRPSWPNYYYVSDVLKTYIPHISDLRTKTPGNTMALGNCTWWAWERRYALGKTLPSASLGNAGVWGSVLSRMGYTVDKNVEAGAVFESYGHVGIVEKVNYDSNGVAVSFVTSEMNVPFVNYQVVSRTIPIRNASDYNYIH